MLEKISNLGRPLKGEELKSIKGGSGGPCYACFCHHSNNDPNCCCVN